MSARVSIFFRGDGGMVFFLALLLLTAIIAPDFSLSQFWRIGLSFIFVLTLIFGAFATVHHRVAIYLVIVLAIAALAADLIGEFDPSHRLPTVETALRLACLAILVVVTVKRLFRSGPVTVYRVMGGIAGYLLIGLTWAFAYQLALQHLPGAIQFESGEEDIFARQPARLIFYSFTTLTTIGSDGHPIHPIARSLAIAETLVGQLYIAILIASLVGMAIQSRSEDVRYAAGQIGVDFASNGPPRAQHTESQIAPNFLAKPRTDLTYSSGIRESVQPKGG